VRVFDALLTNVLCDGPFRDGRGLGEWSRFRVKGNPNASAATRVSVDFRVGVDGYFAPKWRMAGTKTDHDRSVFEL
jgi:hypothetical protein